MTFDYLIASAALKAMKSHRLENQKKNVLNLILDFKFFKGHGPNLWFSGINFLLWISTLESPNQKNGA